ncbi:sensor histidine kinase [Rhodococcus sp. NPDC058521]|uniref:sensor histidine kinase n=1 Tax=Rhodococcus sp. NPDC058521 TaxID=3346536 RepID=UPI0036656F81
MRRFSLWLRGKPMVADAILAAVLFCLEFVLLANDPVGRGGHTLYVLFAIALCAPIVWRRRFPRSVAAVVLAVSLTLTSLSWAMGDLSVEHPALLALPIVLYTLVAYVGRKAGAIYLIALTVDAAASTLLLQQPVIEGALLVSLMYALAWITAEFLGARHAYDEEVAARLQVAEYDRDRRAHEAVAAERTRIARELHDVVAHAVSVMIVQADGATYAIKKNPASVEPALRNIAGTGREALAELRRTVSLLRVEDGEDLPQHGTAGLASLVAMMRSAGLRVELELTGELDEISPSVSLGVHRLVQESLTNVLRHAGPNPKARVRVQRAEQAVVVEVTDNGKATETFTSGSGNGLLGMRERVAVLGGTVAAGRRSNGSWRVRATLPLDDER